MVPAGGFRGYGARTDDVRYRMCHRRFGALLDIGAFEIRRKNMIRPGDWIESVWKDPQELLSAVMGSTNASTASKNFDNGSLNLPKPTGEDWVEGGIALAMLECGPPTEHRSGVKMSSSLDGSYHLAVGSTEMGNGSVTSHRQIAASVFDSRADHIAIINADTDQAPYDTGTFASTGTVVAGKAVALAAEALRDNILDFASGFTQTALSACCLEGASVLCGERRIPLVELYAIGSREGHHFEARRKAYLSPRSVAFNVHGVRVAVHRITGEIEILQSVHAADIGRLINPMQCRGQIEGAIAMGFGWALYEKMVYDGNGAMVNPAIRDYRIPTFADIPRSEVYFADTYDTVVR